MPHDLLRICHAALASHGSLFAILFMGGLAGGVTHCAGMCGPFVLSQTARALDDMPLCRISVLTRLRGAALLPYHAGRMTTYAALGAAASFFSTQFRTQSWFGIFSAVLLVIAGFIFLLNAFPFLRALFPAAPSMFPESFFKPLRFFFARPRGGRGYFLGLALGLLPCGLVYAAIFSVAAREQPLTAIFGMILFGLGTVPALVAVSAGGQFAFRKFDAAFRYVFPVLMTMNSLTLFAMAGDLIK